MAAIEPNQTVYINNLNEKIKKAFDASDINIPYPQQVVRHIHQNPPES